jgi:hypothetical protein
VTDLYQRLSDPDLVARRDALVTLAALRDIVPDFADPEGLMFDSRWLGQKFGFDDGDVPEAVRRMVDTFVGSYRYISTEVWHHYLLYVVNTRLLPALGDSLISVSFAPGSLHNPIRLHEPLDANFAHASIRVPWVEVLADALLALDNRFIFEAPIED